MNDNQVLAILIAILRNGFNLLAMPDIAIKQSYQPTKQGTPEGAAIFIHKIMAPRYGHPGRRSTYNAGNANFDTVDSIWRTPTFQISGLSPQNPADAASLTASDIVETAADILQTESTRETLLQSGIGIYRILSIRESYFVDDRDRHEQEPSFDVTLTYRREFQLTTPAVTATDAAIYRI